MSSSVIGYGPPLGYYYSPFSNEEAGSKSNLDNINEEQAGTPEEVNWNVPQLPIGSENADPDFSPPTDFHPNKICIDPHLLTLHPAASRQPEISLKGSENSLSTLFPPEQVREPELPKKKSINKLRVSYNFIKSQEKGKIDPTLFKSVLKELLEHLLVLSEKISTQAAVELQYKIQSLYSQKVYKTVSAGPDFEFSLNQNVLHTLNLFLLRFESMPEEEINENSLVDIQILSSIVIFRLNYLETEKPQVEAAANSGNITQQISFLYCDEQLEEDVSLSTPKRSSRSTQKEKKGSRCKSKKKAHVTYKIIQPEVKLIPPMVKRRFRKLGTVLYQEKPQATQNFVKSIVFYSYEDLHEIFSRSKVDLQAFE